jgi:hypothetical protein
MHLVPRLRHRFRLWLRLWFGFRLWLRFGLRFGLRLWLRLWFSLWLRLWLRFRLRLYLFESLPLFSILSSLAAAILGDSGIMQLVDEDPDGVGVTLVHYGVVL